MDFVVVQLLRWLCIIGSIPWILKRLFDGLHNVVIRPHDPTSLSSCLILYLQLGGSFATIPRIAQRRTVRNCYQLLTRAHGLKVALCTTYDISSYRLSSPMICEDTIPKVSNGAGHCKIILLFLDCFHHAVRSFKYYSSTPMTCSSTSLSIAIRGAQSCEELKISIDETQPPLPTKLSVSQLLKLATKLAAHVASRVPEAVIKLLDSVIELRTKHRRAFYSQWPLSTATQKANKGHSHYLETLPFPLLRCAPSARILVKVRPR